MINIVYLYIYIYIIRNLKLYTDTEYLKTLDFRPPHLQIGKKEPLRGAAVNIIYRHLPSQAPKEILKVYGDRQVVDGGQVVPI